MGAPEIQTTNPRLNQAKVFILTVYSCSLVVFGLLVDSPREIFQGIKQIITSPDTLISDYIGIGGIGAAFVNAGLLSIIVTLIFYKLELEINGFSIACLFTVAGFGLFGKNILNVWLIIVGVFLYAKFKQKNFQEVIYGALFGTALAPVTTEILFSTAAPPWVTIPSAILTSIILGFILIPVSANLLKVHKGFNLYNMGFTAGIVGSIFVSLFNSYGIIPEPQMIWTSGNNRLFIVYLFLLFSSMIVLGIIWEKKPQEQLQKLWRYPGQLVTDFVVLTGFGTSLINMGINGILVTMYVIWVGGALNGPTIGGILTVVGFSALGKHPINTIPIIIGVYLGSLWKPMSLGADSPSMLLAALFGTTLAPIAGQYGIFWGIVAGFIHSSFVQNVGSLHGGLNLYNNGFAAGIVAAMLIPVIEIFVLKDKQQ